MKRSLIFLFCASSFLHRFWYNFLYKINNFSYSQTFSNLKKKQTHSVEKGKDANQDRREEFSTSKVYPMAGAVLGSCLGGPVGFLAGVKIGGLAAVGGGIFGKF